MSVEDRLYALVAQARQQHGDAFLRSSGQLVPMLSSQAPDLHGEIRALAAALEMDAAGRLAAGPGAAGEIGAEIAGKERLSMAVVQPAIAVAQRIGPLGLAMPTGLAGAGSWAGDSVIAGVPPPAPPAPYYPPQPQPSIPPQPLAEEDDEEEEDEPAEPIWKNKWVLGAAAAAGLFFFYQSSQKPEEIQTVPIQQPQGPGGQGQVPMQPGQVPGQPGAAPGQVPGQAPMQPGQMPGQAPGQMPGQTPGPMAGPGGAPPQQGGPALLQPPDGNLPTLSVQRGQDGSPVVFFQVQTRNGAAPGMIGLPANGWEAGPSMFGFLRPGNSNASQPDTMGMAVFQRSNSQSGPVRMAQPSWQQDNVGLGNICVAFIGPQGSQDVPLQGSTMCVMDGSCSQAAGCGRLQ